MEIHELMMLARGKASIARFWAVSDHQMVGYRHLCQRISSD
jgi:hypothetical protein